MVAPTFGLQMGHGQLRWKDHLRSSRYLILVGFSCMTFPYKEAMEHGGGKRARWSCRSMDDKLPPMTDERNDCNNEHL